MKASTLNFIWSIGYYAIGVILLAVFFHGLQVDTWYDSAISFALAVYSIYVAGKKSDLALKYAEKESIS
jgi:hypothetical protein